MPLPEKISRNQAVIALYICGFSQREIANLLGADKRNVQLFIRKYTPRYLEEILVRLVRRLAKNKIRAGSKKDISNQPPNPNPVKTR